MRANKLLGLSLKLTSRLVLVTALSLVVLSTTGSKVDAASATFKMVPATERFSDLQVPPDDDWSEMINPGAAQASETVSILAGDAKAKSYNYVLPQNLVDCSDNLSITSMDVVSATSSASGDFAGSQTSASTYMSMRYILEQGADDLVLPYYYGVYDTYPNADAVADGFNNLDPNFNPIIMRGNGSGVAPEGDFKAKLKVNEAPMSGVPKITDPGGLDRFSVVMYFTIDVQGSGASSDSSIRFNTPEVTITYELLDDEGCTPINTPEPEPEPTDPTPSEPISPQPEVTGSADAGHSAVKKKPELANTGFNQVILVAIGFASSVAGLIARRLFA